MPSATSPQLLVEGEVLDVRPSASKPDRGIVRMRYQAVNQRGEPVLSMIGVGLFARKPAR